MNNTFDRRILVDIGEYAKKMRVAMEMTQEEISKELNVTLNTIQNFEYGRSNNAILLFKYLKLFDEYKVGYLWE